MPFPFPGLPRFTGGAVGFIGYEFIHDVEPVVPRPSRDDLQTPTMYFLIADELLIFDRVHQTITVLVNAVLDEATTGGSLRERDRRKSNGWFRCWNNRRNTRRSACRRTCRRFAFESNVPKEKFFANVLEGEGIHHCAATSSRWSGRNGSPRR